MEIYYVALKMTDYLKYKTRDESVINYKFDKNIQNGIKSNSIWSIFTDNQDRVWLGYYNNGIDVHNDNYNKFESLRSISGYSNSLSSSSVTGIIKDNKERLWISTSDGGIDVFNIRDKDFENIKVDNETHESPIARSICI